jgi:hypothetical protein
MPVSINNTQVVFDDATVQTTAYPGSAGGGYNALYYTTSSPGTYSVPASLKAVRVTVIGGGGGGGSKNGPSPSANSAGGGGSGGAGIVFNIQRATLLAAFPSGNIPIAVGAGGTGRPGIQSGNPGGTSSFGTFCSATGGTGGAAGQAIPPNVSAGTSSGTNVNYVYPGRDGNGAPGVGGSLNIWSVWVGAGAARTGFPVSPVGAAATGIGSGGAGGSGAGTIPSPNGQIGGPGTPGVLLIEEFF